LMVAFFCGGGGWGSSRLAYTPPTLTFKLTLALLQHVD